MTTKKKKMPRKSLTKKSKKCAQTKTKTKSPKTKKTTTRRVKKLTEYIPVRCDVNAPLMFVPERMNKVEPTVYTAPKYAPEAAPGYAPESPDMELIDGEGFMYPRQLPPSPPVIPTTRPVAKYTPKYTTAQSASELETPAFEESPLEESPSDMETPETPETLETPETPSGGWRSWMPAVPVRETMDPMKIFLIVLGAVVVGLGLYTAYYYHTNNGKWWWENISAKGLMIFSDNTNPYKPDTTNPYAADAAEQKDDATLAAEAAALARSRISKTDDQFDNTNPYSGV